MASVQEQLNHVLGEEVVLEEEGISASIPARIISAMCLAETEASPHKRE